MNTMQETKHIGVVRKWGNGYGVLLPKILVDTLRLNDASVTATLHRGSIVLSKVPTTQNKKLTLADMVRGMNRHDRHEVVDFGKPQGKEIW